MATLITLSRSHSSLLERNLTMCHSIQPIKHSYKLENINGQKFIPVWKVITRYNKSPIASYLLYPISSAHLWTKGWNYSNRYSYPLKEVKNLDLTQGFYFLPTKKEAQIYVQMLSNMLKPLTLTKFDIKIVKMHILKEDIVSTGITEYKNTQQQIRSICTSKAYWKGN